MCGDEFLDCFTATVDEEVRLSVIEVDGAIDSRRTPLVEFNNMSLSRSVRIFMVHEVSYREAGALPQIAISVQ